MIKVRNEVETQYGNLGRNGFFKAGGVGIDLIQWDDVPAEVHLFGLTGKGAAGRCRITVSMEKLTELRAALDVIEAIHKGERSQTLWGHYAQRIRQVNAWVVIDEADGSEAYDEEKNQPRTFATMGDALDFIQADREAKLTASRDCAAGLHSWIGATGKLPPHTQCKHCGEEYGHPD